MRRPRAEVSRAGLCLMALAVLLGAAAANTGNNLLYLITSAMLSLMALSGASSLVNLLGLEVSLDPPEELFAGVEAPVRLRVRNRKRLPSFLLRVEAAGGRALIPEVPPGRCAEAVLWVRPPRRGIWRWEAVEVWSGFPMGFVRRGRAVRGEARLLVFPHPLPAPLPPAGAQGPGGERWGGAGEREGELRGLRDHRPLEDIRLVHWKASARVGRLLSKEMEGWSPPRVVLRPQGEGVSEEDLGRMCWLVLELARRGWEVGLELPGTRIEPGRGWEHRRRLLGALALWGGNEPGAA